MQDVVVLEKYRNYNKNAVIVDFSGDNAIIYVDTAAIRKEDVIICNAEYSYSMSDMAAAETAQKTEIGTKMSQINLDDYVPYLTIDYREDFVNGAPISVLKNFNIDRNQHPDEEENFINTHFSGKYCNIPNAMGLYGRSIKMNCGDNRFVLYNMTSGATYPNVDSTQYSSIDCVIDGTHPLVQQFIQQQQPQP